MSRWEKHEQKENEPNEELLSSMKNEDGSNSIMIVEVSDGRQFSIDAEDWPKIKEYSWYIHGRKAENTSYVYASKYLGNYKKKAIILHRLILDVTDPSVDVDHIDGNGLNNRKQNLRKVTRSQNNMNSKPRVGGTSKFKGVCWAKHANKWRAQIQKDKKRHHIGYYESEIEAALAYDLTAELMFAEYARINGV